MDILPIPKRKYQLRKDLLSWLIALPSIALFIFFIWVPLLQNVVLSFQPAVNSSTIDFGFFDNYLGIFQDYRFQQAVVNTLLYVLYSLLIGFIIPIILALVISELIHTKSIFKIGFYIPNIVPAIAVILMWKIMMDANDYGFFNIILQKLGLGTSLWLSEKTMTIPLIILTLTWKSAGSTMLIYLATLQSIDPNLYEASRVHGAGLWKRLRYITLPALFANVKLLLIMQIISIFQIFYEPLVFMGSSNDTANTLGLLIYKYAFGSQSNIGYGAALGVIVLIILLGFTFVYLYFDKKTNQRVTKNRPYVTFEILSAKTAVWHRHWFYRFGQKIKNGWNWLGHQIQKAWCFLRLNRFCHWLGRGATRLTNQTKKVTLRIFRKKKEGILGYSDYKKTKYRIGYYVLFILISIWLIIVLVPFIWLFFTSFKSATEIYQSPSTYTFFPKTFDFGKYGTVIGKSKIWQNVGNSLLIALGSAIASILFNGLLAYVVAILKPKGSKVIYYLILGSMLIPSTIALFPLFQNITALNQGLGKIFGLSPTKMSHSPLSLLPLMLIAGASPFNFLLFYNYFQGLPQDLFDSAQLDGATRGQIFFKIVIPLSTPILMVVGIFAVTAAWNDFLLPYLLLSNDSLWTVMVKIFTMNSNLSAYGLTLDGFLCLLIFTMIPPILVFFVFQKNITSNVATAGLK